MRSAADTLDSRTRAEDTQRFALQQRDTSNSLAQLQAMFNLQPQVGSRMGVDVGSAGLEVVVS